MGSNISDQFPYNKPPKALIIAPHSVGWQFGWGSAEASFCSLSWGYLCLQLLSGPTRGGMI